MTAFANISIVVYIKIFPLQYLNLIIIIDYEKYVKYNLKVLTFTFSMI